MAINSNTVTINKIKAKADKDRIAANNQKRNKDRITANNQKLRENENAQKQYMANKGYKAPTKPKPEPKPKPKPFGDSIYQRQIGEYSDSEKAYLEDIKAKRGRSNNDHKLNTANVKLNKTQSIQNSAEDYASRGMMRSGVYQTNLAQTEKLYNDQTARMAKNNSDDNSQFTRDSADYSRGIRTQKDDAKAQFGQRDALRKSEAARKATTK